MRLHEWVGAADEAHVQTVLLVVLTLFIYGTCYHANDAVLPFIVKEIGASDDYGFLKSWFAILQLGGGVVLGRAGDEIGGMLILVVTQLGSAVHYGLLGVAKTETVLFLAFIPALLQQGCQASVMIIADLSSEKSRVQAIGRLSIFYGVGAFVGPAIGGYTSQAFSNRTTVFINSGLSAALALLLFLAADAAQSSKKIAVRSERTSIFSIAEVLRLTSYANVGNFLLLRLVYSVPAAMLSSMLSEFLRGDFGMRVETTGIVLSYIEAIRMIAHGALVGAMCDMLTERRAMLTCFAMSAASFAALSFAKNELQVVALLLPLTASGMVGTIISAIQTRLVPTDDTGGVVGLDMAMGSLSWVVAPLAAEALNKQGGFKLVCGTSCATAMAACMYAQFALKDDSYSQIPESSASEDAEIETFPLNERETGEGELLE